MSCLRICMCFSDMVRRWCTLEGGFLSYYDNEKIATPIGRVDIADVVSLAINNNQTITETGCAFTSCLFLSHPLFNERLRLSTFCGLEVTERVSDVSFHSLTNTKKREQTDM